jgi:hypothetical protein
MSGGKTGTFIPIIHKGDRQMSINTKTTVGEGSSLANTNPHAAVQEKSKRMHKRIVGAAQRRAEIMVATLFLVTAAVSIPAAFLLDPILQAPNYLAGIAPNTTAVALGALGWSINNIGIVFIAVFMFPLLRRISENAAVGYLAMRIIEGTVMMFGIAATLMLIPLSGEFLKAGAPLNSWYQTLGDSLVQARLMGLTKVSLPLLGLGGIIFTWQLVRFKLVPRAISVTGLAGYVLILIAGLASWFGVIDASPQGNVAFLALPVATFEIILLPFWLFFRGFKMPEAAGAEVAEQ